MTIFLRVAAQNCQPRFICLFEGELTIRPADRRKRLRLINYFDGRSLRALCKSLRVDEFGIDVSDWNPLASVMSK